MAKYEVWKRADIGQRTGRPTREHYTLDVAMQSAIELSVGSTSKQVWDNKAKPAPNGWGGGNYVSVDIPNSFAVIERGDKQSRTRGWGVAGKWLDARTCKRCNNTGQDPNAHELPCSSCNGSSYVPKV